MSRSQNLDNIAPDDIVETSLIKKKKEKVEDNFMDKQIIKDKIYTILGHTKNPFSSFLVNPKIFNFVEKDESEEIFLVARPHWFTNVSWILTTIVLIFIPMLVSVFGLEKILPIDPNFLPVKNQLVFVLFWYLIIFIFAFEKFLSWYFNVFIITNQRVVDIDFRNMLNKHFSEADLSVIQDISSTVRGIGGTFFNFGTVLIQTASEINEIIFEKVPNPEKIIKVLQQLREAEETKGENRK
jgi:hypothetical protein